MSNSIDVMYFRELAKCDPGDICRRSLCGYDNQNMCYIMTAWGNEYAVYPHENKIDPVNRSQRIHEYFYLFIIYYLLNAKETDIKKEWISEKDIPGGSTFFRGPHEIPARLITKQYNNNIMEFDKRCRQFGGIPFPAADAAFSFNITPRIPAAVLYWKGDEEFQPEAKILYDRSIIEHLSSGIIFAMAVEICTRIGSVE